MKHNMKLKDGPFNKIKSGTKTIELRLLDEKRKLLNIKDIIEFTNIITNEKLSVEVLDLYKYDSFEELYKHFDKISFGYEEDEEANPKDMEEYYSKEEQEKYGVVGIKIKKLEDIKLKLNKLKCINTDNDLDEYLKFYKYVKDNMTNPEWLGEFTKKELEYILKHGGKLFNYFNDKDFVCSFLYIPSNNNTLIKHKINYEEDIVGSCGPIMVNPNYLGNKLQIQMLYKLDEYCKSLNKKYIFTKVHPDNIYSINNFENSGYEFIETYESKDGIRNCYLKKL